MDSIETIVFCDLDGVLVDWNKGYKNVSGGMSEDEFKAKYGGAASLNLLKQYGVSWWINLEWMPDGKKLWEYIQNNFLRYKVLTAVGKPGEWSSMAKKGKYIWMKNNLPDLPQRNQIVVGSKSEKKNYARPGHILIDDTPGNIRDWITNGGIGILHENALSTIQKLKTYE